MRKACLCAGDLRHRVEIQAASATRDRVGGQVTTWAPLATVWAKVEPMSAREAWWRQQMNAAASWKISLRYRADLTTKHRVVYDGRTFEIRGVTDPDQRKRFLELACDELIAP